MINSIQYTQDTQEDLYNLLKILKLPVRILNNNMNYWFVRTESGKYYKDFKVAQHTTDYCEWVSAEKNHWEDYDGGKSAYYVLRRSK